MTRKRSYQQGSGKLHNGQWSVRYREFGYASRTWVMKREGLGKLKDKKAARKAAEPIMARVNERNNCANPKLPLVPITFREFIDKRWRAYTVSAEHQVSTVNIRNSLINRQLMPFFGEKVMTEITPSDISDFLKASKLSINSRQQLYSMLNLMFEMARQYDVIEQNPVRPLIHRPEQAAINKPTLTPAQVRAILAYLPDDERLYNLLLAVTGMRCG